MLHEEILQTMGVSILRPRFAFDNAAKEDLTVYIQQSLDKKTQSAEQVQAASSGDYRNQLLAEMGQLAAENSSQNISHVNELRCRYRLVRLDHCVMLLEQAEPQWAIEQPALSFLNDIYFALFAKAPSQWQQAVFEWPPSQHYPLAGSVEQARQTLQGFVQHMLQNQTEPVLIAWGNTAKMLSDKDPASGELLQLAQGRVLVLEALPYYWQSAENKRQLWQQLQVLRKT